MATHAATGMAVPRQPHTGETQGHRPPVHRRRLESWGPAPDPIKVDVLALTSLGAFMDVRGTGTSRASASKSGNTAPRSGATNSSVLSRRATSALRTSGSPHHRDARRADPLPTAIRILWQRHYIQLSERVRPYSHRGLPGCRSRSTRDDARHQRSWTQPARVLAHDRHQQVPVQNHRHRPGRQRAPLRRTTAVRQGTQREAPDKPPGVRAVRTDRRGLHHIENTPYEQLVHQNLGGKRVAVAPTRAAVRQPMRRARCVSPPTSRTTPARRRCCPARS